MLQFMAKRRREHPKLDIQREEVKMMNGVKLLVESGWVCDLNYFTHLCEVSGIDKVHAEYKELKERNARIGPRTLSIIRFANKFSDNLGMPNFFGLDRMTALKRSPEEVSFTLDHSLYPEKEKKSEAMVSKEDLAKAVAISQD